MGSTYWTQNTAGTEGPNATPGQWQLLTYSYNGGCSNNTAEGMWSLTANSVVIGAERPTWLVPEATAND